MTGDRPAVLAEEPPIGVEENVERLSHLARSPESQNEASLRLLADFVGRSPQTVNGRGRTLTRFAAGRGTRMRRPSDARRCATPYCRALTKASIAPCGSRHWTIQLPPGT